MKLKILSVLAAAIAGLLLTSSTQAQMATGKRSVKATSANTAVQQALVQALAGPDGEYAAYVQYAAFLQQFGDVQPYAAVLRAEERHIAALKRQFEVRGLAVPENPYLGKLPAPATLQEAAAAGIAAEERNVAMYDQLLAQVQDQPDLVRVFTHLQFASREHHLAAFQAASANNGQVAAGEFCGGQGCGQGRGGPPPWAGGAGKGKGMGQGRASGGCGLGVGAQCPVGTGAGRAYRGGAAQALAQ